MTNATDVQDGPRSLAEEVSDFYAASGDYDPGPLLERLLKEEPVHHSVFGFWIVSRHADIVKILREGTALRIPPKLSHEGSPLDVMYQHFLTRTEPPAHERLRGLVQKAFTSRAVRGLEEHVRGTCMAVVAKARNDGEIDLAVELARPLPIGVMSHLLDIPLADTPELWPALEAIARGGVAAHAPPLTKEIAESSASAVVDHVNEVIRSRRDTLGEDLLSSLIRVRDSGEQLDDSELLSVVCHLIHAGTQTTIGTLTHGLLTLFLHAEQWHKLTEDPSLAASAFEEILRYAPPARLMDMRVAVEDIHLDGAVIPAGQEVALCIAAGNRDPSIFENPEMFDIARKPNPHLSFGSGIHFCLGVHLDRLVGKIVLETLARELPDVQLQADPVYGDWSIAPKLLSMQISSGA